MNRRDFIIVLFIFSVMFLFSCSPSEKETAHVTSSGEYEDLVALFRKAVTHKPWGHNLEAGIHPEKRTMSQIGG